MGHSTRATVFCELPKACNRLCLVRSRRHMSGGEAEIKHTRMRIAGGLSQFARGSLLC